MVGKTPKTPLAPVPSVSRKRIQPPDPPLRVETFLPPIAHPSVTSSVLTHTGSPIHVSPIVATAAIKVSPYPHKPDSPSGAAVSMARSLEEFYTPVPSWIPNTEADGTLLFKRRQYVAVDHEHFVQVVRDPASGHLRATLSIERTPSGPWLQRDPVSGFWRCVEQPRMETVTGAWGQAVERPAQWQVAQLFRRLGQSVAMFSDATVARILAVSGIDDDLLHRLYARSRRPPALLEDTVRRFKLDQQIRQLVTHLESDDPSIYVKADPQLQLLLLKANGVDVASTPLFRGDLLPSVVRTLDAALLEKLLAPTASAQSGLTPLDSRVGRLRKLMARWARHAPEQLFKAREEAFELDCNETTLQIRRVFPNLPKTAAMEIWRNASASERLRVQGNQSMSDPMMNDALLLWREIRIARACEGIYLPAASSLDSDSVALLMIADLSQWPRDMAIEIRHYDRGGKLLAAVGKSEVEKTRILVRTDDGYVIENGAALKSQRARDVYSALLLTLQPAQRQALGLSADEGKLLQRRIRTQPLPSRQRISEALELPPTPIDTHGQGLVPRDRGSLRGGGDTDPAPSTSDVQRLRELYPALSEDEVAKFMSRGGQLSSVLTRLEKEFATLRSDLAVWSAEVPAESSSTGQGNVLTLAEQRQARQQFSAMLQDIWQRKSVSQWGEGDYHFSYYVDFSGELPRLSARFEYVTELILTVKNPDVRIGTFLDCFPNIQFLGVVGIKMEEFPSGIFQMRQLSELTLDGCALKLSEVTAEGVSRIETLTLLNLANNPLTVAPHIGYMAGLSELMLSNANLSSVPSGIGALKGLELVALHDNNISDVGYELFDIPDTQDLFVGLVHNPLSDTSRQRIEQYLENSSMDRKVEIQTEGEVLESDSDSESSESGISTASGSD